MSQKRRNNQNKGSSKRSVIFNGKEITKNAIFEVVIEDMTSEGEGIGRINGYALFIKGALVQDVVKVSIMKVKKTYGYGRLLEIVKPSPYRIEPRCSLARQCGGCQLQHCSYEQQLKYKHNKIKSCLERIGKLEGIVEVQEERTEEIGRRDRLASVLNAAAPIIMEPMIGLEEPYYYRNKAQFPVGKDKEGNLIMGFYAGHTHSIIDTTHCYIQSPINERILQKVKEYMLENKIEPYEEETQKGIVRHILTRVGFTTKEIMVCLVINANQLPQADKLVEKLREIENMKSITININKEKTNVILGSRVITLWGQDYITDYIGNIKYQISPLSFYQVNPIQTQRLYATALEYAGLSGEEIVWDLYCGIGTISLFLAEKAKQVYGVEIVPEAIADAKRNAKLNQISNVEFFVGAAEEILPQKYEESGGTMAADVIMLDPPRKGCDELLLQTVVNMEPKKVVYVSCNPATLARDLRYLCDRGYRVEKVRGCDMFSQTVHVETCVLLSHKNS